MLPFSKAKNLKPRLKRQQKLQSTHTPPSCGRWSSNSPRIGRRSETRFELSHSKNKWLCHDVSSHLVVNGLKVLVNWLFFFFFERFCILRGIVLILIHQLNSFQKIHLFREENQKHPLDPASQNYDGSAFNWLYIFPITHSLLSLIMYFLKNVNLSSGCILRSQNPSWPEKLCYAGCLY